MAMDEIAFSQVRQREELLLSQEVRRDKERLSQLFADDFREFGASGRVFKKQDIIDSLISTEEDWHYRMDDFQGDRLADDTILITYRLHILTPDGEPLRHSLRSSIWRKKDQNWALFFHQGTGGMTGGST